MDKENITRGELRDLLLRLVHLNPIALTKEFALEQLEPVVLRLKKDLGRRKVQKGE